MKIKVCFLAILLSLMSLGALGRGDPNGPNARPGPGKTYGLTAPNTVTLNAVLLTWEWTNQADYYHIYGKAPGTSRYVKVGQTDDEEITLANTVRGTWKYVVRGCGDSTYCGEFSAPTQVTFQACHDPNTDVNGVQSFSIITNTTQCLNLDLAANEEIILVYSNVTDRDKFFYVNKDHNRQNATKYLNGRISRVPQEQPYAAKFTPPQSKVYLGMNINHYGHWDEERTQVMVIYDEPTRVLSLMYMPYEGSATP